MAIPVYKEGDSMDLSQLKAEIAKGLLEKNIDGTKYNSIMSRATLRVRIKVLELLKESYPVYTEEFQNNINLLSDKLNDSEELIESDGLYLKEYHKMDSKNRAGIDHKKLLMDKINQIAVRSGADEQEYYF